MQYYIGISLFFIQTERKNEDDDPRPGIDQQSNVNGESNDVRLGLFDDDNYM